MKYLIFFLLFINLNSFAQTADWLFTSKIEKFDYHSQNHAEFKNILTDTITGDSYIFSNLTDTVSYEGKQYISKEGNYDLLILKLDKLGKIIWTEQIGGPSHEFASSLAFHNGELLLGMWFFDSTEVNGQQYFQKDGGVLLIKLDKSDATFNSIHQFNLNGSIFSLATTENDEVFITGRFSINSSIGQFDLPDPYDKVFGKTIASEDIFIAKLDQNLLPTWVSFSKHSGCCISPDVGNVKINPVNNDIIIIGRAVGDVSFEENVISGTGSIYSFMVCYTDDGDIKWIQKSQSATDEADVYFTDLDITDNGEIYLVGIYDDEAQLGEFKLPDENGNGYTNGFVAKLNDLGEFIWAKSILGANSTNVTSIICKDNTCYFGGSFRDYLKFDNTQIADSIKFPITMGYIGKVEDGENMNKVLLLETTDYSKVTELVYNKTGFLTVLGHFEKDISIGCLSGTNDYMSPFASHIDINGIEEPVISGNKEVCYNAPYFVTIDNYDPNYNYTLIHPAGISVTNQSGGKIELTVLNSAPDTVTIHYIATNNCNWKAVSNSISFFKEKSPDLIGEILTPDILCEGSENQSFSIAVVDNILLYNWYLPEGISADGKQEISTESNTIEVEIEKSFKGGFIKLFGTNNCGISNTVTKEISVFSKLPTPALTGDPLICNRKDTHIYQANFNTELIGDITYYWEVSNDLLLPNDSRQDSSKISQISVEVNGVFDQSEQWIKVYATNECYTSELSILGITGSELPEIPEVIVGECDLEIEVKLQNNLEWHLNGHKMDIVSNSISDIDSGFYQVRSFNNCGEEWSPQVYVDPIILDQLIIPNIITPNGDGYNEKFVVDQSLKDAALVIYNRWGGEVYKNNVYSNEWDANNLSSGLYYYVLKHNCLDQPIKGTVTVLK